MRFAASSCAQHFAGARGGPEGPGRIGGAGGAACLHPAWPKNCPHHHQHASCRALHSLDDDAACESL